MLEEFGVPLGYGRFRRGFGVLQALEGLDRGAVVGVRAAGVGVKTAQAAGGGADGEGLGGEEGGRVHAAFAADFGDRGGVAEVRWGDTFGGDGWWFRDGILEL